MASQSRRLALLVAAGLLVACHDGPTKPRTGTIVIAVDGLPAPATPVILNGPNGFAATIGETTVFPSVALGRYTLTINTVRTSTTVFGAPPGSRIIDLVGGRRDSTYIHYTPITGSLSVVIGVLQGVVPLVHITGPNAFAKTISSTQLVTDLEPGSYTLSADTVSASGYLYASNPVARTVPVVASASPTRVTLTLAPITGSLAVSFTGLPQGANTGAQIDGPNGYARTVTANTTITGLTQGAYTVTTTDVAASGLNWRAGTGVRTATVSPGTTIGAAFDFAPVGADGSILANVRVDGFTLTQVVQRDDNSIPMIGGRGAYLRVTVLASTPNSSRPPVRVRYYLNGAIADSTTIDAPVESVPTVRFSDPLTATWDIRVPAALVRPGLAIQVEVDPNHQLAQATRADDAFPANAPRAVDVRTGAVPAIRLVPVLQATNGFVPDMVGHSLTDYLGFLRRIYPLGGYDGDLRETYTTTGSPLDARDSTGAWTRVLNELDALRVIDGSSRYYYGIVHVAYPNGIAGLGYVSGRSAMGWDHWEPAYLSTPAMILAHELGHNFGRWHSPGCGAGGVDPLYPYPNGNIGVTGWDSVSGNLVAPTMPDLMTYCHPEWISDYTYSAVLDALTTQPPAPSVVVGATLEPCLLVWGRIEHGVPVLEPAFEVRTRSVLPARAAGAHALRVLDTRGADLLRLSFDAQEVADLPDARSFAFAIPLSRLGGADVGELRLSARGREARLKPPAVPSVSAPDPELRVTRSGRGQLGVRWNADRYPMVMVRNALSGEVVAFARAGATQVWTQRSGVELTFSDGVRSTTRRVSPR